MKTLIKATTLFDGTGTSPIKTDLLIENQKITRVEKNIPGNGALLVNGEHFFLAPGFIDIHAHSDFSILLHPEAEGKLTQGVTTEVIGNCGQSAFPLLNDCQKHRQEPWERFGLKLDWHDLHGYKKRIERRGTSLNLVPLIGHGNIRACAMGYKQDKPSFKEMAHMQTLLQENLEQGAFGLSTGLLYLPGAFSKKSELKKLLKQVGQTKGIYTTHLRNEGDTLLEALQEAIELAEATHTSLQISHFKTWGEKNWEKCDAALEIIRKAKAHFDRYPYLAANTDLDALLPSWVYEGGRDKELLRLQSPKWRKKITRSLKGQRWSSIVISSVKTSQNKRWEGISIDKIAKQTRQDPFSVVMRLLIEEDLDVSALFFAMCEENLTKIYQDPHCMIGSDSSARPFQGSLAEGKFHPRTYGTFPRFLATFVKKGILSWEEAIRRMTGLPAEKINLEKRGKIAPGYFADLVLFDPLAIKDNATFEEPCQSSSGIQKVWVNGELVVDGNKHTGKRPGKVLLRS